MKFTRQFQTICISLVLDKVGNVAIEYNVSSFNTRAISDSPYPFASSKPNTEVKMACVGLD
jgi:hypothetical protein